jgi:hypothetical protein
LIRRNRKLRWPRAGFARRVATGSWQSQAAILLGGFIAGTIDIGFAASINRVSPTLILHFIAAGLFGHGALEAGVSVTNPHLPHIAVTHFVYNMLAMLICGTIIA